jgi:hypothetical protein
MDSIISAYALEAVIASKSPSGEMSTVKTAVRTDGFVPGVVDAFSFPECLRRVPERLKVEVVERRAARELRNSLSTEAQVDS